MEFLVQRRLDADIESYPTKVHELLTLLRSNTDDFVHLLNLETDKGSGYLSIPIIKYADLNAFAEHLRELGASNISKVCKAFKDRYKHAPSELVEEQQWLERCLKAVEVIRSQRTGTMAAFWLDQLVKVIGKAVLGLKARRTYLES